MYVPTVTCFLFIPQQTSQHNLPIYIHNGELKPNYPTPGISDRTKAFRECSLMFFLFCRNKTNYKKDVNKVNLATVVEVDQKAPFSIATTLSCREGSYSFPWIAPLYP